MQLKIKNRFTHAHDLLVTGLEADGASVTRRAKGYSDFDVIRNLVRLGWLEPRNAGPRGGVRYFTTPAGKAQLESLKATQE